MPKNKTGLQYCVDHHSVLCKNCYLLRRKLRDKIIQYRLFGKNNNLVSHATKYSVTKTTHDQVIQTESILNNTDTGREQSDTHRCKFCNCCSCPRDKLHKLRKLKHRRPNRAHTQPSPLIPTSSTPASGTTVKKAIPRLLNLRLVVPRRYQTI